MKITVYTIKDCAFSKQEKEYLNTNKLTFEEKNLETNKGFLTEMLAISNNFAGTPVTRVEKDDGTISVLKGFTKEEFDTTFGFAAAPTTPVTTPSTVTRQINDTPIATEIPPIPPTPIPIPVETPVVITPDLSAASSSKVSTAEEETSTKADPLKSVMDDLQSKSLPTEPIAQPVEPTVEPLPPNAPNIPDFPSK